MAKFGGKNLVNVNSKSISLEKGGEIVNLTVASLTSAYTEKLQSLGLMDQPTPPQVPARNKKGQPIRDEVTKELVMIDHLKDPTYVALQDRWLNRYTAMLIRDHLRLDTNIEWGVKAPTTTDKSEWANYADALVKELFGEEGCFTDAEGAYILSEGRKIGCKPVSIDEDLTDFLAKESTPE